MNIWLTGDTHGDFTRFSCKNWPESKNFKKENNIVIILGDFGGIWSVDAENKEEISNLKWLDNKPWITFFVDGNHENLFRLNKLPSITDKNGNEFGKVSNSIFHLKRGHVYNFNGLKFFVFGGACSSDKVYRKEHISWWPEEMPNDKEYKRGLDNLKNNNNEVDYVLTHIGPGKINYDFLYSVCSVGMKDYTYNQLEKYFEYLNNEIKLKFKHWYFGHHHIDESITYKYTCLYENIIEIKN